MSAKKRRRKAQIVRLVQLDENHSRLYLVSSKRHDGLRAAKLWWACIVPLGDKLGTQAWAALHRCELGKAVLVENYRKRVAS